MVPSLKRHGSPWCGCALRFGRTGTAVSYGECDLHDRSAAPIFCARAAQALLACWAGHRFSFPITVEVFCCKPFACPGLPALVVTGRTDKFDAMIALFTHEQVGA